MSGYEQVADMIARAFFFGMIYLIGYERGRRVELDDQCKRIDGLIERTARRKGGAA